MFEQIMVPLDGSALAERALPCAEHLAQACGARLHLVRVVDVLAHPDWAPVPLYIPEGVYESALQEATTYVSAQQERLSALGLQVQTAVPAADVAVSLLDYEREARIDLVVLCSHGRSGVARFAVGSVAERLLRYGRAPLLLVRAFGPPLALQRAVVPLDGSARAEAALDALGGLKGRTVREVTLLRVIATPAERREAERYLAQVARRVAESLMVRCQVEQGDPAGCIAAVAGAEDLVVMATHGRTGLARWALGSVADRVAHSDVAGVLLVRTESGEAGAVGA